jgi:subtilisin family serine protease
MRRFFSFLLTLPLMVSSFAQTAAPGTGDVQRYIVRVKDSAYARGGELLSGFRVAQRMQNIPVVTVNVTQDELKRLRSHPDVEYVSPDHSLRAAANNQVNDVTVQAINGDQVWNMGNSGNGVTVAVIDSGIDSSLPDFGNAQG